MIASDQHLPCLCSLSSVRAWQSGVALGLRKGVGEIVCYHQALSAVLVFEPSCLTGILLLLMQETGSMSRSVKLLLIELAAIGKWRAIVAIHGRARKRGQWFCWGW
jgi:hypothetical protein